VQEHKGEASVGISKIDMKDERGAHRFISGGSGNPGLISASGYEDIFRMHLVNQNIREMKCSISGVLLFIDVLVSIEL